jgi:hypothetical protein
MIYKHNMMTRGLSGACDDFVFKQFRGKTVLAKKQSDYYSRSEKQDRRRNLFQLAVAYGKKVIADAELKSFYQSLTHGKRTAYHLAVSDFMNAPDIKSINMRAEADTTTRFYVDAADEGRIVSMSIRIENSDGSLFEEGNAQMDQSGRWTYKLNVKPEVGSRLIVSAVGLPGNSATKEMIL